MPFRRPKELQQNPSQKSTPNPDQAWKVLGLVVDWIKHAEAKAGATLAATAASGVMLYNLSKELNGPSVLLVIALLLCGFSLTFAGVCAGLALWPRLRTKEEPISHLYFSHTARAHAVDSTYIDALLILTGNPEDLVKEIAAQGWANSKVAHKKYFWCGLAIRFLLSGLVLLAVSATVRVLS
ncbi:Pycsar system effector family protein [Streptomyces sp. NPDC102282]|uniref:Pycsar system effector family protein n=1 Tax=Streptomyces sp. NPDC102282 TaxID=3366154 RepID=UPI0037FA94F0